MVRRHARNTKFQHWPLLLVVLIFVILASIYSFVFPLGEINDEIPHFALVRFIAEHRRPPMTLEERDTVGTKGDASPFYHVLVALLTQHVDVSHPSQLPEVEQKLERLIPHDGRVRHNIFHTEDDALPFRGIALAWHLGRLISIPLGAATIIGVYLIVLAIYPHGRYLALAAASLVAFIPRFVISSAVINDDNLVFPLITFALLYLIWVAQGNWRPRTLIILGVIIGLATFAKYHSLVLIPIVTLLLLQLAWQQRWGWQTLLRRWAYIMLAFAVTVGWWFVFLLVRFNQVAELGLVSGVLAVLGDPVISSGVDDIFVAHGSPPSLTDWLNWADLTYRTFWFYSSSTFDGLKAAGKLGAYWGLYVIIVLLSVIAALGLLKRIWKYRHSLKPNLRQRESAHPGVTVLVVVFLAYLLIVAARYIMQPSFVTAQGRHLFPALASIAFFFVLGWDEALQTSHDARRELSGSLRSRNDHALALWIGGGFLAASIFALSVFIIPVFYPFLPLEKTDPNYVPIAYRVERSFADGVNLVGFDLNTAGAKAGEAVPLTLYWHVGKEQVRDYLVNVCLHDEQGQVVTCRQSHPVDGRYPMRAWEEGYVIRDAIYLPTPACLPAGSYELRLSVVPLRIDTPVTSVDDAVQAAAPISLGQVWLRPAQGPHAADVDLWVEGKRHNQGRIVLTQVRQSLTTLHYQPQSEASGDGRMIQPLFDTNTLASKNIWSPVSPSVLYDCPGGLTAVTHNFILDLAIAPDKYRLVATEQSDTRLTVEVVTRARDFDPPRDEISNEMNAMFAEDVELLGYDIDLTPRQPGDVIDITTYWRAWRTMDHRYISSIHLLDDAVTMWGQSDNILGGTYPHILWAPGEYVKEELTLTIAPDAPPGLHSVEFGIFRFLQGEYLFLPVTTTRSPEPAKHIILGHVRVLDPDHSKPPDNALNVDLGKQIRLLGFDLSGQDLYPKEPLDLTLYWQAIDQPSADYTVFTQIIGPDGQVWGQQDNQPQEARYPTTYWEDRDRVLDRYKLTIREGAPPGQYQLLVGMYNLQTGQRLYTIDAEGNRLQNDAIPLVTLAVQEDP